MQSGDESEDRESQIYSSTSARDINSTSARAEMSSTSVRDSWDPNMSSKDTWDPKFSSKDTWDPKIRSRDTWEHTRSSKDSWELSTSTRDSLEPRTSVYRNPLQVSQDLWKIELWSIFAISTLYATLFQQETSGVSGVYISSGEPGFAEILPGEVQILESHSKITKKNQILICKW